MSDAVPICAAYPDCATAARGRCSICPAAPDRPGDRDHQQAAEVWGEIGDGASYWRGEQVIAAALAAARADGDQLRQRLETLAKELEREAVRVPQVGRMAMADRIRAVRDAE